MQVLVVEDDRLVADAVKRLLAAWGMTAHLCASGSEALEVLEGGLGAGGWFGLLDYRLQNDETGLDVADAIRARFGQALPLALLTGELDPAVFKAARRRGIVVLHKPLRPIRLRAVLSAAAAESATA
jgi:CheY-like chemotaxis protein